MYIHLFIFPRERINNMNCFNEKEFRELCKRFNAVPHAEEVVLEYARNSFFNKMRDSVASDRPGEVVFCVIRPDGRIIAITCSEYPRDIFRIPTGGIHYGENIVEAVLRETHEELGLDAEITDFAGVLKIKFVHENESFMFFSYIFILKETGGRLLLDASDDEISEVREVDLEGLESIVSSLAGITGRWSDWGKFRHVSSEAVLKYLKGRI